jgi:hypothetical protein
MGREIGQFVRNLSKSVQTLKKTRINLQSMHGALFLIFGIQFFYKSDFKAWF